MVNRYWSTCINCGYAVKPGDGDLTREGGKWLVKCHRVCGTELDTLIAEIRAEKAEIESRYGPDVKCWLSDDYGLTLRDEVYRSYRYAVYAVHDGRMPERICCAIYDTGQK